MILLIKCYVFLVFHACSLLWIVAHLGTWDRNNAGALLLAGKWAELFMWRLIMKVWMLHTSGPIWALSPGPSSLCGLKMFLHCPFNRFLPPPPEAGTNEHIRSTQRVTSASFLLKENRVESVLVHPVDAVWQLCSAICKCHNEYERPNDEVLTAPEHLTQS